MEMFSPAMLQAYATIRPHFDEAYYLKKYFDVRSMSVDPVIHFIEVGWREGRNPSADFNTLYYLNQHEEEVGKGRNPLLHYIDFGRDRQYAPKPKDPDAYLELQRQKIGSFFDAQHYRGAGDDLPLSDDELLNHYLQTGWKEGRNPCATFDVESYVASHPYVRALDVDPFFHSLATASLPETEMTFEPGDGGSSESAKSFETAAAAVEEPRPASVYATLETEFDRAYYLRVNTDVRDANNDPIQHYIDYGWREGRNPSPTFWTSFYLEANADVSLSGTNPFFHYLAYGRLEGRKPNPIGTPLLPRPHAPPDKAWLDLPKRANVADATVDIIVPVYRGYDDTLACLYSVLSSRQDTSYELVVINDCGPQPELNDALRRLGEQGYFTYLENENNLGFVGTANRGLSVHDDRDAVLLNSDTVVFFGWLDRLLAHADMDPSIATITPFSNSATVCSYPLTDRDNIFQLEASAAELDAYAAACNRGLSTELPSGVGFCLYVRRAVVDEIGLLDRDTFGRGYGEENDLCMRAIEAGYRNVFAHDVYVHHSGETSFQGDATGLRNAAQDKLAHKHPTYHPLVRRHIRADPARYARRRLDAYRLAKAAGADAVVFVLHAWGGGIERHIEDLAGRIRAEGKRVLTLRVAGEHRLSLELSDPPPGLYLPNLGDIDLTRDAALLGEFLQWLDPSLLHVHAVAGLADHAVKALFATIETSGIRTVYTWHDFAALCHRNHFVTADGHYCGGRPAPELCGRCLRGDNDAITHMDLAERGRVFGKLIASATQIIAPSEAAARYARAFTPERPVAVKPHPERYDRGAWLNHPPLSAPVLKIAIVGAIGPHKGSDLLYGQLTDAQARGLPIELVLIGHSDQGELKRFAQYRETGRYRGDAEAIGHLHALRPHLCYFPSIWPETFCYTLSLAFATGIPPVVFDLGAQAERVRAAGWGMILPAEMTADPAGVNDALLAAPLQDLWAARRPVRGAAYPDASKSYYNLPS